MKKFITVSILAISPVLAFAQTTQTNNPQLGGFTTLLRSIGGLVNLALPIVVGLALLAFFYGLLKFIFAAGDAEKRKESQGIMVWGVVALFVMVCIWGLVGFLANSLGIGTDQTASAPTIQNLQGI